MFILANKLDGDLDYVTHRNHSLLAVLQLLIALHFLFFFAAVTLGFSLLFKISK